MVVEGYEVSSEIETGAVEWVRGCRGHHGDFTAKQLVSWLVGAGVPTTHAEDYRPKWGWSAPRSDGPAYRLADRIIQRERKLGSISFALGAWHRNAKVVDGLPAPSSRSTDTREG